MKVKINKSEANRIEMSLYHKKSSFEIYISSKSNGLQLSGEAILSASLLPTMIDNDSLNCEIPISPKFFFAIQNLIQDVFHFWDKSVFHKSKINAKIDKDFESRACGKSACFFTGGVDSFYTLLKNKNEISDIIYVHGFDIKLDNYQLRDKVSISLKNIANSLSLNLIEIETNLRDYLDNFLHWELSHGSALSFVAHCLPINYDRIFLAASHTYAEEETFAWGSHPFIDHFWGGGKFDLILDGSDKTRPEKVKFIASNEVALKYLRVCWLNTSVDGNHDYSYNCGKCEKCIRTMLSLYFEDKLDACRAFPEKLTPKLIRTMRIADKNTMSFLLSNIKAYPPSKKYKAIHFNLILVLIAARMLMPLRLLKMGIRNTVIKLLRK